LRTVAFWLSLVLIFTIPWENFILIESLGTVSRAIGFFVAAFWVVTVIVTGRFRKLRPFHLAVYLFVLWNVLSAFWSLDIDSSISRILTYFQLAVLVWILWDLYTTPAALRAGLQAYVLGCYVAVVSTVSNYLAGIQFSINRYAASGFNPNDLGLILALGIPLAWHLAVIEGEGKYSYILKIVNLAYLPAATIAILLTASRGALVAASASILFVLGSLNQLGRFRRILIFVMLVGALFVVQGMVPEASFQRLATMGDIITTSDLPGRVTIWREGFAILSAHPLLGVGSGAFKAAAIGTSKVAHNVFVSVLVELGIIGFILFTIILVITVYQALRQPKWTARLWLTVLLVWGLGVSFMTWEIRKPTWMFLSLVIVSAALTIRRDESRLHVEVPFKLIESPKGETCATSGDSLSTGRADLGNVDRNAGWLVDQ
jgi:O-antigen ligase